MARWGFPGRPRGGDGDIGPCGLDWTRALLYGRSAGTSARWRRAPNNIHYGRRRTERASAVSNILLYTTSFSHRVPNFTTGRQYDDEERGRGGRRESLDEDVDCGVI